MGVSRTGFYAFHRDQGRPLDSERQKLLEQVKERSAASQYTYGSRWMARTLQALGYRVGRNKARRLMREAGVLVRYRKRYKVTTDSDHQEPLFPNRLQRDFEAQAPNQKWVADLTYIWTREGWLYLAVFLDLYSRSIVGWSLSNRCFPGTFNRQALTTGVAD